MMMVHPDHSDPNYNNIPMTCRSFIQLLLDVGRIDASIDNKILKTPHDLLVHLAGLDNGINPDIGTLKKYRGDIFS